MSKKPFISFLLLLVLFSCQEEITPLAKPTPTPGDGNNGDPCVVKEFVPVSGRYSDCLPQLSDTTIDILTWNLQNFPKTGNTVAAVKEIIEAFSPDIIAFQEIQSLTTFNEMIASLDGWSGIAGGGSLRLAYAYKNSEVALTAQDELFAADASAFPRRPLRIVAQHSRGKEITLINLHLKCCDDGNSIPRRKDASIKLKAFLDAQHAQDAVVVLGDMNEDITQPEGNGVFTNFIEDENNYRFADMDIARCSSTQWSYPDWPSHIDHILITNELFDADVDTRTLTLRNCNPQFKDQVTDHQPVMIRLKAE